ncbi:curlin repeat-containing protein [Shewanella sp. GXUN23E]|uniref:curlin repeat-containing protein n=1 Tax=Shewanella sp. GXUN23E TaxID=3422498 RepID=UPI003D7EBC42
MSIQLYRPGRGNKPVLALVVLILPLLSPVAYSEPVPVTLQLLLESHGRANLLSALQLGDHNQLEVLQVGNNDAVTIQSGSANLANVQQLGTANQLVLEQQGNNNAASVSQYGEESSIQIFQYGEANFSIQQLASGEHVTVTQY